MKCKEHPKYQARRHPVKTAKYPDGCPTCWGVWEHAKTDPKRLARTVNVELSLEEARLLALTLGSLIGKASGAQALVLQTLQVNLAQAVREA